MTTYTVHEPPHMLATREARAESLVFVRDGFSWGAFLFGPLYFLVRREWSGLIAFVVAALLLRGVMALFGAGSEALAIASITLAVIAGFEANEIRRASLSLFGWRELAAVSGRSLEDCEHRFFGDWLSSEPMVTPQAWQASPFASEGRFGAISRITASALALTKLRLAQAQTNLSAKP